jgi:hypothetical protein
MDRFGLAPVSRRAFMAMSLATVGGLIGGRALMASVDLPEEALASLPDGEVKGACKNGDAYVAVGALPDGTAVIWEYRDGAGWRELSRLGTGAALDDIVADGADRLVAVGSSTTNEQVGTVMAAEQDPPPDRELGPDEGVDEVQVPVFRQVVEPGIWTASAAADDWQRVSLSLEQGCLTSVATTGGTILAVGALAHDETEEGALPLVVRRVGGRWEQLAAEGLPQYSEGAIGALAVTGDRWVLASTDIDGSTLYESSDAGGSWTVSTSGVAAEATTVVSAIAAGRDLTFGLESLTGAPASVAGPRGVTPVGGAGEVSVQAVVDPEDGSAPVVIATGPDGTQQASQVRS